jgi:hypothetical protein
MNIVFLDIDGVLNNSLHSKLSDHHHGFEFDPMCISNVIEILDITESKLVITSTWRIDETVTSLNDKVLKHYGLDKYVVAFTPVLTEQIRGNEVELYLKTTELNVTNYIILDDDKDMGNHLHRLVRTNPRRGLDKGNKNEAIKLLLNSRKQATGGY